MFTAQEYANVNSTTVLYVVQSMACATFVTTHTVPVVLAVTSPANCRLCTHTIPLIPNWSCTRAGPRPFTRLRRLMTRCTLWSCCSRLMRSGPEGRPAIVITQRTSLRHWIRLASSTLIGVKPSVVVCGVWGVISALAMLCCVSVSHLLSYIPPEGLNPQQATVIVPQVCGHPHNARISLRYEALFRLFVCAVFVDQLLQLVTSSGNADASQFSSNINWVCYSILFFVDLCSWLCF
jgi:hypothetical protein